MYRRLATDWQRPEKSIGIALVYNLLTQETPLPLLGFGNSSAISPPTVIEPTVHRFAPQDGHRELEP